MSIGSNRNINDEKSFLIMSTYRDHKESVLLPLLIHIAVLDLVGSAFLNQKYVGSDRGY
jgi:hypothetical protein